MGQRWAGPIKRQKTFFFFDYEGIRQALGVTAVSTVPSPQAREGHLVAGTVAVNPLVAPYRIRQTKPVFDIERVPISRRNRSARFFARWMRLSKVGHRVGCESNQVQAGEVSAGACSPGCRREARQFLNLNVCEAGKNRRKVLANRDSQAPATFGDR